METMEQGDMVLLDYVGRAEGEIFDLTVEDKAKEEGLELENYNFEPIPVLVGEQYVIEGLDEALQDMEVGEEQELDIEPEKAYGERDSEKVQTYPEKEFKKQGVDVAPGEEIMVGRQRGRVLSVGSGRVRVDFNHPLAGNELNYWVKVVEKVEDDQEIAENILSHLAGHFDYEVDDGVVEVEETHSHGDHEHNLPEEAQEEIERQVTEYTDLEVEFV